jgi:hypothetical protein
MMHPLVPFVQSAARFKTPLLVLGTGLALTCICKDQFDERSALERAIRQAIEAAGGEARLASVRAATWKAEAVLHKPSGLTTASFENTIAWPDRHRLTMHLAHPPDFEDVEILNGNHGWFREQRQVGRLRNLQIKAALETNYVARFTFLPVALRDPALEVSLGADVTVADRPAVILKVVHPEFRDILLYYDKETGLLVRRDTFPVDRPGEGRVFAQQTYYSDHRPVEGITVPFKFRVMEGKWRVRETEITAIEFHTEPPPDELFAAPAS